MRWIVDLCMRFRLLVVGAAATTLIVGISQIHKMPVDVLPEFGPVTVEVQTEALGLSSAEVEQLITVPIEQDLLNGIAFLEDIRSESVPGLSRILLVFEPGTDLFQARQVVAERMTQAHALPNVSRPPQILQPLSSTNRVMIVGVNSSALSPIQMSVLARWTIVPRLLGVPGVANVSVWGQRDRQLQVQVDPERLRQSNVSLIQVIATAGNALWVSPLTFLEASTPGTGGFIDTANQRLGVQHISPISTPAALGRVIIEGSQLHLGDVATVIEDHPPLIGDALTPDGAGLLLVVEKAPGASTLDVTRQTESALKRMQPGLSGVKFDTGVFRPATYIESAIGNIEKALIIGAVLTILVLAAFLLRWRPVVISLVAIPLSLITAVLVLYALDTTMNAVVLVGLIAALGLVIDDAIVNVDNIVRRLRQAADDGPTAQVVLSASLEAQSATVYATLTIALAIVPVFFLEQVSGTFYPQAAVAYLLALLAAMVIALTVTPALSILLLSRSSVGSKESSLVQRLQNLYESVLARVVRRPQLAWVAAGAFLVAGVVAAPFAGTSVLPSFKESQVLIRWEAPPGTSLPEMNRVAALIARELRAIPGVNKVGGHVGRALMSDRIVGINSGDLWATIDPEGDYDATVASIKNVMDSYPGLSNHIETYSNERVRKLLTGTSSDDVVVRLYGEELAVLQSTAEKLQKMISETDGVAAARVERQTAEPTIEVQVKLDAAEKYGLKPGDARRAASTLLSGIVVGNLFEEQQVFDVVVWGTPDTRRALTEIRRLLISTPDGGYVRLGEVADVRIAPTPPVIKRQAVSRRIDILATVHGRDRGSVALDIERRLQSTALPLEYHAEVLGTEQQPAWLLAAISVAAAIGMLLLLQACFGSWRLATLSFLTPLIAVAGGMLAARIAGGTLSLGSYIGLFAVCGIGMRNGVLLMSHCQHLEHDEGEVDAPSIVLRGSRDRLAPILMTALSTGLIALTFVAIGSVPGQELVHPLAIIVLGGVIAATISTLFIVPALYVAPALYLRNPRPSSADDSATVVMKGIAMKHAAAITAFFVTSAFAGVFALSGLIGSVRSEEPAPSDNTATVEEVADGLKRITLTAEAAKRIDVQTAPAWSENGSTVIPYAAVLYDPDGATWTYTSSEPLAFIRKNIEVDRIEADRAILTEGPAPGTAVVTVGSVELWGVEYGGIEED